MFDICKGLQMVTMSYKSAKSRKIFSQNVGHCFCIIVIFCCHLKLMYLFICIISSEKIGQDEVVDPNIKSVAYFAYIREQPFNLVFS